MAVKLLMNIFKIFKDIIFFKASGEFADNEGGVRNKENLRCNFKR
jgi:hypothetical protein